MSIIKVGQNFTLTLETSVTLSTANPLRIDYEKPDQTTGTKTASVISTTSARANFLSTDIDQNGTWKFQVYAEISGAIYKGATFEQDVTRDYK